MQKTDGCLVPYTNAENGDRVMKGILKANRVVEKR